VDPEVGKPIKWRARKSRNGMNTARHGRLVERNGDALLVEYSTMGLNKFKKITIQLDQVIS
jgi:hypothetical protein